MIIKPNFFIIGAPKCGTTSLATWLSEHPEIFMSVHKEPHYFNNDDGDRVTLALQVYEKNFAAANSAHKAIGEASVWYFFSHEAISNIEEYSPGSRYIVCLRNPVGMAYSLHEQQVVNGNENIKEFDQAWQLSESRLHGDSGSWFCSEPRHLSYGNACKLGEQFERLVARVGRDRVLAILLDDVIENPRLEYQKVLKFLGLDDDGRTSFAVSNPAKERKSLLAHQSVRLAGRVKRRLGIHSGMGILNSLARRNIRYRPREPMSPELREELRSYFEADIKKLGALLDRDLSNWFDSENEGK